MKCSTKNLLFVIVLIGFLLRFPGVFWGFGWFQPETRYLLHHDEDNIITKTYEAFNGENIREGYPPGFAVQIKWVYKFAELLKNFLGLFQKTDLRDLVHLIFVGRILSLLYGTATPVLTYLIAKNVFDDERVALLSSALTAFTGLSVIESHFSTTDVSATFWMYASLLFTLYFYDTKKLKHLFFASLSTGFVIGTKSIWFTLLPLAYFVLKSDEKIQKTILVVVGVFLGLALITNFLFYPESSGFVGGEFRKNADYWKEYFNLERDTLEGLWTPLNYLRYWIILAVGLSLPVFVCSVLGLVENLRRGNKKIFLLGVPLLLYYITVSLIPTHMPRFMLPVIPYLALNAACFLTNLFEGKNFIILLFVAYQITSAVSMEYNYFLDTREVAGRWMLNNIPTSKFIASDNFDAIPLSFDVVSFVDGGYGSTNQTVINKADYLILNEPYYRRCLKNIYRTTWRFPKPEETYKGAYSCGFIQSLLSGREDFTLIKKFETKSIMPEMFLFKKMWGSYTTWAGDTLIYEKKRRGT